MDSGHLSLLHTWWARRPLASCRAMLLALLLPDPCDELCPDEFIVKARTILRPMPGKVAESGEELRAALLTFIGNFADWDYAANPAFLEAGRALVKAAHPDDTPLVVDPFAGGGSIPLEALRLGCDAFASDLNPVAWLLLATALDWSAHEGRRLSYLFAKWSEWVLAEAQKRLVAYYPPDEQGRKPLAYLWARTIRCEASGCGAIVPLVRNLWLSEAAGRRKAIRFRYVHGADAPEIEIFSPSGASQVARGTVARFRAVCPNCHQATARERVRAQLRSRRGGAENALLLAVVRERPNGRGKDYFPATPRDLSAIEEARAAAVQTSIELAAFPQGDTRAFPPGAYGIGSWVDLLTPRQRLSRRIISDTIEDAITTAGNEISNNALLNALAACLYAGFSDNSQYHTSLCVWLSEGVTSVFIQGSGVPMRADFVEGSPLSRNCEGLQYSMRSVRSALSRLATVRYAPSSPLLADAVDLPILDESAHVAFTDPPYADQIPYAHLSDFFYGFLRWGLKARLPQVFNATETEKARELVENPVVRNGGVHDRLWYENGMERAFATMKRVAREDAIASVIFAHKDTERWESLVSAMLRAGWCATGSWPIATERRPRMRGQGYAALETSVHLVCRPRTEEKVGDWGDVLRELPERVGEWMARLEGEGVRGADLVFACIGPALEIFSRYSRVETPEGREVPLAEYLEKVWEVVGREALHQVLGTAEAQARNGGAGALEEDARLTALFLWTIRSTAGNGAGESAAEEDEEEAEDAEEEDGGSRKAAKGFALIYDIVRRFAQPLGIHLQDWEGRIVETEKGVVRLLPVAERARQLFGAEGAAGLADRIERAPVSAQQLELFPEPPEPATPQPRGRRRRFAAAIATPREATTLDRVHTAMLLQASGRATALRALLAGEQERGPDFLRLAQALIALYPQGCEERRLLEAMLLAVPR